MAYDAKFMRNPEMNWLGAFPSDFEKYSLPTECLLPLTEEGMAFPFDATVSVHASQLHHSLPENNCLFSFTLARQKKDRGNIT